ncbi:undecaprenyl-diphosphatase [Thermosipho japonicus]|uniref:Undecaprenyl-diphosphatase n=1 Tax=Thermosipho japonicus TaxID=90323 RepID=A0A841GFN9_9BACT|nr:undecaprenyl-diphosphate phosphatase [Thermosipho japonicus]MBB6062446.1 undecaprenyl-diphosphatase [Thermosipho japonicus]
MNQIVLGLIQGLTEFLPISSSGHLTLFSYLFNIEPNISNFAFLHLATLAAIIVFVWKEIVEILKGMFTLKKEYYSLVLKIIISTIPAAIFGFLFNSTIENSFSNLKIISFFFLVTAASLFVSDKLKGKKDFFNISYIDAFIIGLFQMIAIFPGISRSGITLFGALTVGLKREKALKYSFLMGIPVILGAGILETSKIELNSYILISGLVAFLSGLLSLLILKKLTISKKLKIFSYYCILIAIIAFLVG